MKNLIFLLTAVSLFSCKKYKDDGFFSTYSAEKRLINTSANMWSLKSYSAPSASEKSINENNFNLIFTKDSVSVFSLNSEQIYNTSWKLESNKKYLTLSNGTKFEILQLEVDKLKLKNEQGEIYSFKKIITQKEITVADESIFEIPLFGLSNVSSTLKLTDVNHCETNNMSVSVNGNIINDPLVSGLFENGIGYTTTLNSIYYNFSKYYFKPGEMTFYYKKEAFTTYSLAVKINGVQTSYSEIAEVDGGINAGWGLVKVNVPSTGNLNFSIQSTNSGGVSAIRAIDEIKFWEYH
jgi:hypothetical protein